MKKFLGAIVSVGVFVILVGAAVAQMEHGSGHNMHGTKGQAGGAGHEMMKNHMGKGGHAEMMKNHMGKSGHDMKSQMSKAGHEMMKNHMSKGGHEMKSHAGKAVHE
jgi:hypothetical protein